MAFKTMLLSKKLWLQAGYLVLAWAMVSVDFNDPTLFNLMYPAQGVQNGAGHFGALVGGTLLELLGPVALFIPWFLIRLSVPYDKPLSWLASGYHILAILLTISVLHSICEDHFWQGFSQSPAWFFFHAGYIGMLGNLWLQSSVGIAIGSLFLCVALLFSSVKIASILPFQSIAFLIKQGLLIMTAIGKRIIEVHWIRRFIKKIPFFPHSRTRLSSIKRLKRMLPQSRTSSSRPAPLEEWAGMPQEETEGRLSEGSSIREAEVSVPPET